MITPSPRYQLFVAMMDLVGHLFTLDRKREACLILSNMLNRYGREFHQWLNEVKAHGNQ